jgi:hypothetical protein
VHQVIYEIDVIRVQSVTNKAGQKMAFHHHPHPAVLITDVAGKISDVTEGGEPGIGTPQPGVMLQPPQPKHIPTNIGDSTFHLTRIDFKKNFPQVVR